VSESEIAALGKMKKATIKYISQIAEAEERETE